MENQNTNQKAKDSQTKHYFTFYDKCMEHPNLTKEQICLDYDFSPGRLDSIRRAYKLPSPFHLGLSKPISEEQKQHNMIRDAERKIMKSKTQTIHDELANAETVVEKESVISKYKTSGAIKSKKNIKDKKAGKGPVSTLPEVHSNFQQLTEEELQWILNKRNAAQTSQSVGLASTTSGFGPSSSVTQSVGLASVNKLPPGLIGFLKEKEDAKNNNNL